MRIIGGTLRGKTFDAPSGHTTRPMLDRIRQALFNIVEHHDWGKGIGDALKGANVMDAFCGTGALAFEALSRGAAKATLFDSDTNAYKVATANAAKLGLKDRCRIMPADTLNPPKAAYECRLVFVAPPYRKKLIAPALAALDAAGWIASDALIVAETARKEALEVPEIFVSVFNRSYADTSLHFLSRESEL
jgi:16S rRNA (guanine966-N2)-methyltransferase